MLLLVLNEGGLTFALTVRLAAFVQSVIAFALSSCTAFSLLLRVAEACAG